MVRIRDGLAVLWRAPGEAQIGTDPRCAVVLTGLSAGEQALLGRLRRPHTPYELLGEGRAVGLPPARTRRLLSALDRAGVLTRLPGTVPDPTVPAASSHVADVAYWTRLRADGDGSAILDRRREAVVAVLGLDRLGMLIATGLASCGVGRVVPADADPVGPADVGPGAHSAGDVGRPREIAAAEALRLHGPARSQAPAERPPDLAVLVEPQVASPIRARPLVREDVPHLSVVIGDVDVRVGPLVVPGTAPCLRCLDLHRCDADERWPAVATQLAAGDAESAGGVESSLAPLAAALAVGQVLAHLDGRPAGARGATLEVSAAEPIPIRREWAAHPECGCGRLPDW